MENDELKFEFFEIDELELDKEWLLQPKIFYSYAERLAKARKEHEQLKAEKELVVAQLDRNIRSNPGNYGLEKVTEEAVKNAIIVRKKYQQVNAKIIEGKYNVEVLQGAVDSLEHRKKALENMVVLFVQNYTSSPRPSKITKNQVDDMKMSARKKRNSE